MATACSGRRLVAGIDAGATSTRCLVVDDTGARLAAGRAGGANQNSSASPAASLTAALSAAFAQLPDSARASVRRVVVGVAGAGTAGQRRAERAVLRACRASGLARAEPEVRSDIEIAFAAGTVQPDGTVLISGTGAAAARIEGYAIARRTDGLGYLLGDSGSAVWIGLQALRSTAAAVEGYGPSGVLTELVLARVADDPAVSESRNRLDAAQQLVAAVYGNPPSALGRFAPLVDEAAGAGDPLAIDIAQRAVGALIASVGRVRDPQRPSLPLVVSGAVACGEGPLGTWLRDRLHATLAVEPLVSREGSAGAAACALRGLPGVPPEALAAVLAG